MAGGRAVDDDDVPVAAALELLDLAEHDDVVDAGRGRRHDVDHARRRQSAGHPPEPVLAQVRLQRHRAGDRPRTGCEPTSLRPGGRPDELGQHRLAVQLDDQDPQPGVGRGAGEDCRYRGLADASLARHDRDAGGSEHAAQDRRAPEAPLRRLAIALFGAAGCLAVLGAAGGSAAAQADGDRGPGRRPAGQRVRRRDRDRRHRRRHRPFGRRRRAGPDPAGQHARRRGRRRRRSPTCSSGSRRRRSRSPCGSARPAPASTARRRSCWPWPTSRPWRPAPASGTPVSPCGRTASRSTSATPLTPCATARSA